MGGRNGNTALDVLLCMRDEHGSCPVLVVKQYPDTEVSGVLAEIEVQIPKKELVYACARCGRWETLHGPRFRRCGGCKSRYYCSPEVRHSMFLCLSPVSSRGSSISRKSRLYLGQVGDSVVLH